MSSHLRNRKGMTIQRREFLKQSGSLLAVAATPAVLASHSKRNRSEEEKGLKIQRLSWAGIKLEVEGATLFIDPWTNANVWGGAWKEPIVPLQVDTPRRDILITHFHTDHFDYEAIKTVIGTGRVLCDERIGTMVVSRGVRTHTLALHETYFNEQFTITPVLAVDGLGDAQVSWVVSGGGKKIIHCGDTIWHGHWWQIARQFGPFDYAFLPINGVKVFRLKPLSDIPASLTPEQAVAAAQVLGANSVIPIHYGLNIPGDYEEYPNAERTFLAEARRRKVNVKLVKPGEWV